MLTNSNQIFRNCFVIIHYHLTKVLPQIKKCIIFEYYLLYGRTDQRVLRWFGHVERMDVYRVREEY